MATKDELDQMLQKTIETNKIQAEHIKSLWEEIGEKQSTLYELKGEIYDLKDHNRTLAKECKECLEKEKMGEKAQFQKEWLENFNPRKVDN